MAISSPHATAWFTYTSTCTNVLGTSGLGSVGFLGVHIQHSPFIPLPSLSWLHRSVWLGVRSCVSPDDTSNRLADFLVNGFLPQQLAIDTATWSRLR